MDDVLINFIQILRRCGLKVSIAESLDGARAAALLGMDERPVFKSALRAALIKRTKDIPLFEQVFDAYFTDTPSDIPLEEMFGHGLQQGEDEDFDRAMREASENMGDLDDLTRALLEGNVQVINAEMLRHMSPEQLARLQNMMQRGQLVRVILDKMGWQKIQEKIADLIEQLMRQGDFEAAQKVQDRLWELQELFPKWVRSEVQERAEKQLQSDQPPAPVEQDILEKDFDSYTEAEIEAMAEIIDQLARKLREDWSRRAKAGGSRRLDVTRTMRAAMSTMGVPMELRWKQKKRNRLRLALLCDVSSSVRDTARFMLQLVYSLQQQRGRIRSFVFIGDMDEVTQTFEREPIDDAVRIATSEAGITYWSHSDFGNSFREFLEKYGDAINSRTTVVVLGDGRNNHYSPQYEALQEIRERARRVIWLNPESHWGWGTGDSIAPQYARFCDKMVECRNLAQLQAAMESLISQSV